MSRDPKSRPKVALVVSLYKEKRILGQQPAFCFKIPMWIQFKRRIGKARCARKAKKFMANICNCRSTWPIVKCKSRCTKLKWLSSRSNHSNSIRRSLNTLRSRTQESTQASTLKKTSWQLRWLMRTLLHPRFCFPSYNSKACRTFLLWKFRTQVVKNLPSQIW